MKRHKNDEIEAQKELSLDTTVYQDHEITPIRVALIVVGLTVLIFFGMLSGTSISTANYAIGTELGIDNIGWVAQSFLITTTALQPVWGRLSDILGRRQVMVSGIVLLAVFSGVSGASKSMTMLIVFRALMGLGAAAVLAIVNIIIADIVPLRQRGKYMGVISAANGMGQVMGPLIGGLITDAMGWRWTMYINVPVLVVTAIPLTWLVRLKTPEGSIKEKLRRIDYPGIVTMCGGIVLILVGLNNSTTSGWSSVKTLLPIIIGVVLFVAFVYVEHKRTEPLLPLKLLRYRNVYTNMLGAMITGIIMYAGIFYIPSLFVALYQRTPKTAGIDTWPWMIGVVVASTGSGFLITKTGVYRPFLWIGSTLLIIGSFLMYSVRANSSFPIIAIYIALVGFGIGFRLTPVTIAAQAAVTKPDMALTTALINFSRSVGGLLGVVMFKGIQQGVFEPSAISLSAQFPDFSSQINMVFKGQTTSLALITDDYARESVTQAFVHSLNVIFLVSGCLACLGFLVSVFVKHIDLSVKNAATEQEETVICEKSPS